MQPLNSDYHNLSSIHNKGYQTLTYLVFEVGNRQCECQYCSFKILWIWMMKARKSHHKIIFSKQLQIKCQMPFIFNWFKEWTNSKQKRSVSLYGKFLLKVELPINYRIWEWNLMVKSQCPPPFHCSHNLQVGSYQFVVST